MNVVKLDFRTLYIVVLACVVLNTTSFSQAATIDWRRQVNDAVTEATKSGRPILVSISTDWCHFCKKMDRETLSDSRVANHVQKCFVPLKLDGDQNKELVRLLGVRSYPTTVILSPKMEVVTKLTGFQTADQLTHALELICNKSSRRSSSHTDSISNPGQLKPSPFGQHCPVTSFDSKRLVNSDNRYRLVHRGYDISFASDQARQQFMANPESYWPVIDGRCAVALLDEKKLTPGSWENGVSFAGRVWFFSGQEQMQRFTKEPREYLNRLVEAMRRSASETSAEAH